MRPARTDLERPPNDRTQAAEGHGISGVLARMAQTPCRRDEPNGIADRATLFADVLASGLASGASAEPVADAELDDADRIDFAPRAPYRTGDIIAQKYQLLRVLSRGGMGSVWVAKNLVLDVDVAVKLIRPDIKREGLTERFMTEARLAACIEHPAIITVFDLGHTERRDPYIVMELLRGEDLRDLLSHERRLSATRSVQLLLPIAEALATAHSRGIVHRDLKPENVFIAQVDQRLQPKLVDFGIAKPSWPTHRRLTRDGIVMGSPEYMAPEQAMGRLDIDHRSDIWSFCIVLYECLTGRPPFSGDNYESTLRAVIENPIAPISDAVDEPELWAIVEKGLSKLPAQRWQSMRELGRALAEWLSSRSVEDDAAGQSLRATWLKAKPAIARSVDRRDQTPGRGARPSSQPLSSDLEHDPPGARSSLPRWTAYTGAAAATMLWSLLTTSWYLGPGASSEPLDRVGSSIQSQSSRALATTRNATAANLATPAVSPVESSKLAAAAKPPQPRSSARSISSKRSERSTKRRASLSTFQTAGSGNLPALPATTKPVTSRRMSPAELEFGF